MPLETLKKRAEFLRVRGGARWTTASVIVEGKPRSGSQYSGQSARFGFTVTKKLGSAVDRNRIRRRLKAALAEIAADHAQPGFDYVLIARDGALNRPFAALKKDLEDALQRVQHPRRASRRPANTDRR